jgi:ribosomal protein S18 acetylase RimI-like enzyme
VTATRTAGMSVPPIAVREARPDELDAAGRVVADAYEAYGGIHPADRWYFDLIRDARSRARDCPIMVAVEEGTGSLVGCVTYVPGAGNPFAELEVEGEAGFRMLGVAPSAQGRGAGEALVRACIERARADGRRGLAISTAPDMHAAHHLYERLGFRRAPDRDFSPVPGVHLLAYTLAL